MKVYEIQKVLGVSTYFDFLMNERMIYTRKFGELGSKMGENAFKIFMELKTYQQSDNENNYKEGMKYLLKATMYSQKEQRM